MGKPETTFDEHGQERDRRGEWRSGRPAYLEPLLDFPTNPKRIFKWFFGIPGFFFPWFAAYMVIITVTYFFLTPELSRMQTLSIDWIAEITIRNIALLTIWTGGFHLWLYGWRKQGRLKKYSGNWMATNKRVFLFSDQVKDNIFWSMSGALFWSAYECGLWWGYANNLLPFSEFASNPLWFFLAMFLIPLWRNFHFYWIHRLLHWQPLYDKVHYLHHKNVNVGPWSGMAMHPIEHILYFSSMLIHLIIPSHPLHMLFNGIQTGLGPALSHSGFDEIVLGDELALKNDRLLHYLHHRHHNVNFGESNVPLDKWFGSFHDGTPEADEHFRHVQAQRINARHT
jgi:sterol desaturase/sphingolipid hydroxylase (fatty acid hydroxylase superfamily)